MTRTTALALAFLALACSPHRLPGTQIRETPDTRAVFDVIAVYRDAMQQRNAAAVLALTAPNYFDAAGTADPVDDVDRSMLEQRLPADLEKVDTLRLDLAIRRIEVKGDAAEAEVFFDAWYRVKTPGGIVPRRDSDVHRMHLRRMDGAWKFTSGL